MNRDNLRELTVFALLLAIGVVGRWYELAWNFTPLAAVTVLGGFYFRQLLPAVLLPIGILTVSNIMLPSYPHWQVQFAVYAMMLVPLALGRAARRSESQPVKQTHEGRAWSRLKTFACCGLIPATLFFVITNFAVWAFTPYYAKTAAGLINCYWMALPFYRWMLAGDLFFLGTLAGSFAVARLLSAQVAKEPASVGPAA